MECTNLHPQATASSYTISPLYLGENVRLTRSYLHMTQLLAVLMFYYAQIHAGNTSPTIIRDYAVTESLVANVDPQKVISVLGKESGFNPTRIHYNDMALGCNSVGLAQIRDCNHPEVTLKQAEDPIFAVNFLIKNIDKCKTWWASTCPKDSP